MRVKRPMAVRTVVLGTASALALAACGGGGSTAEDDSTGAAGSGTAEGSGETIQLSINYWGDFGFGVLEEEYEAANPGIDLVLNEGDYNVQHEDLQRFLVAGSGAPDVAAIDEGFLVSFRNQAEEFVDLNTLGAEQYEDDYLSWKWQQSLGADGQQIGLGTDVGGLAMCYRTDLFEAAGLPTDRDEVSALWSDSWDDFIAVGQDYVEGSGGSRFVDAATNVMNPVLGQQEVGYFDEDETLSMDGGPRAAWDVAVDVIEADLSANLTAFTPEWNSGFVDGSFAVLACPAWMQAYIQGQAPDLAGSWDIADIPGPGGNWGGSWLTVPAQSEHVEEAYAFIEWYTRPEQAIKVFNEVGNLPSQPALYEDEGIQDFTSDFFNGAPSGQIFSATAADLQPQYIGRQAGAVRVEVENALNRVQNGELDREAGWEVAVGDAERVVEGS